MGTPKFMVIDDDRALLDIMAAILQSLDCASETFPEGMSALKALENPGKPDEFDAIFLDVMMPELNGYDVIQRLKAREETKSIPIIMLTAKSGYNEIIEGYNQGADYYLTKPVTKDQLVYALDLVLSPDTDGSAAEDTPRKKFHLPEA
jgi:two-component system response regulator CiaR